MSAAGALDEGSDLSELSDAGSQPATPGRPQTPQTSPLPQRRRTSLRSGVDTKAIEKVSSLTNVDNQASAEGSRRRSSRARNSIPSAAVTQDEKNGKKVEEEAKSNGKKKQNWEYAYAPAHNIFQQNPIVEGKRDRKTTDRYGQDATSIEKNQPSLRRRSSSARASASREPTVERKSSERKVDVPSEAVNLSKTDDVKEDYIASKTKKLNIKLKRKSKPEKTESPTDDNFMQNDEEDSESEQPQKRQRRRRKSTDEDFGSSPEDVRQERMQANEKEGEDSHSRSKFKRVPALVLKPKKAEKKQKASKIEHEDDYQLEDDSADEDVDMSDDADEDAKEWENKKEHRSPREERRRTSMLQEKTKVPNKTISRIPSLQKPSQPRTSSSNIVPAKDLAAQASASQQSAKTSAPLSSQPIVSKPPPPHQQPARPPKNVIRRSIGTSVLDNLMGFGSSSSRDNTPSRTGPPKPKPSPGGNTSSPQIPKRPIERPNQQTTGMDSTAKKTQDSNNLGLIGKHITAEQMAIKKEEELKRYANPEGLFDLLEGAELMMQFEDETRQRLQVDPFLHKYKLYRPGRTEGMWKLIERIKENENYVVQAGETKV